MGESILEEPANMKMMYCVRIKNRPTANDNLLRKKKREKRLTQDAMPLKRSSLGEIGYDAHAVPSLPTIIATEVWITIRKAHLK